MVDLDAILINPNHTIRQAMSCIEGNAKGIALVVDESQRLLGTVTDGDIRRTILDGMGLDTPVIKLVQQKTGILKSQQPVTAIVGTDNFALLQLMHKHVVHQIPVVDKTQRVVDLVTIDDLLPQEVLPVQAVVMAGGFGTRLRPLTEDLPKPMLPVGGRPLLELTMKQLRNAGISRINVTTHYKPEKIIEYFGDGRQFGLDLNYVSEDIPLGTAGALGLITPPQETLLVINGDILTQVDFKAMLAYHQDHQADLTIGVRKYEMNVPYGVVESDGIWVKNLAEKPLLSFFVNAGIYLLEPAVHQFIPNDQRFDMTDLIQHLLDEKRSIVSFPVLEYWLDIGQHADYEQAQEDLKKGRFKS